MKKLILLLAFLPAFMDAQLPNAGFEELGLNGAPRHWGSFSSYSVQCIGQPSLDSLCLQSADAHTGHYALELRNADCPDFQDAFGGTALMNNDSNMYDHIVPFTQRPEVLTFYYKLFPVAEDYVIASVYLTDIDTNQVGEGTVDLTDTVTDYTYQSVPINYSSNDDVAYIFIYITIYSATQPVYGTRFLIDDIGLSTLTALNNQPFQHNLVKLFPNPTNGSITLSSAQTEPAQLIVYNAVGQLVVNEKVPMNSAIDVSHLKAGMYHYTVSDTKGLIGKGKLVKE